MAEWHCCRDDCNVMATYIVKSGNDERWTCGRHVLWAMEQLARPENDWTVTVRYNAWHKARSS